MKNNFEFNFSLDGKSFIFNFNKDFVQFKYLLDKRIKKPVSIQVSQKVGTKLIFIIHFKMLTFSRSFNYIVLEFGLTGLEILDLF